MNGRQHLDKGIIKIVDNQILFRDLEVGQIIRILAEDAQSGMEGELLLQVAYIRDKQEFRPMTVLAILSDNFNFYSQSGAIHGEVEKRTLAVSGHSMTHLPVPIYAMVGCGGIGKNRDYSLENMNGSRVTAIIRNINDISILDGKSEIPEDECRAFLQEYEEYVKTENEKSLISRDEEKTKIIQQTDQKLGLPERIAAELAFCTCEGVYSICRFLTLAKEQGKFDKAVELVNEGFARQWKFQAPQLRADPYASSNYQYLLTMYQDAKVISTKVSDEFNKEPEVETFKELRAILEAGPNDNEYVQAETITISERKAGEIYLLETDSGNRYLVRLEDPAEHMTTVISLKQRFGFPPDGVFPPALSSDIERGYSFRTSQMSTSEIKSIYLKK